MANFRHKTSLESVSKQTGMAEKEYLGYAFLSGPLSAIGETTITTEKEREPRNYATDRATKHHYSSIHEKDSSTDWETTQLWSKPKKKKSAVWARFQSIFRRQHQHHKITDDLIQKDEATKMPATSLKIRPVKPVPKPSKQIPELEEHLEDLTQKEEATEMVATSLKIRPVKPVPKPSKQSIPELEEHLEDLTQKEEATEMPAPEIQPKPTQKQQKLYKELPEIEEHLEEFREQLKHQGCSDIPSMVVLNLNFAGRMMDKKGGYLQLKSHGVMLYIPPDALGDEPQEIFIYVQQNLTSSDHTVKDGFVTPIVHCGTSGLKFKFPVILTFPVHVKDSSQWELTGVRQDSSTKPWIDISDCSSDVVLFGDGLCTVITDHFTGFSVVGISRDSQAPKLRVGIFISQNEAIDPVNGCLQLRVRIWDESSDDYVRAAEENRIQLAHWYLSINTAEVHNSDVNVTILSLNREWRASVRTQILPLDIFRQASRVDESCTFNLRPLPQNAAALSEEALNLRSLECDIRVGQMSHEESTVVMREACNVCMRPRRHNRPQMHTEPADDFSNQISPERYQELLSFYKERERKINKGELSTPTKCSDDGYQGQPQDGIDIRNDQMRWSDNQITLKSKDQTNAVPHKVHVGGSGHNQSQQQQSESTSGSSDQTNDVSHKVGGSGHNQSQQQQSVGTSGSSDQTNEVPQVGGSGHNQSQQQQSESTSGSSDQTNDVSHKVGGSGHNQSQQQQSEGTSGSSDQTNEQTNDPEINNNN